MASGRTVVPDAGQMHWVQLAEGLFGEGQAHLPHGCSGARRSLSSTRLVPPAKKEVLSWATFCGSESRNGILYKCLIQQPVPRLPALLPVPSLHPSTGTLTQGSDPPFPAQ